MQPNPRQLILSLMLGSEASGDGGRGVRELIAACALFGLPENSVRVALARAVAAGLLVTPQRGLYALGPQARALAAEVGRWRRLADQMVEWSGDWIAVHVGANGRSDRSALRARERAFGLLGLAEFERGLHLRPDNLAGGVQALRVRLAALLPEGAGTGTAFVIRDLAAADSARACGLWDVGALDTLYGETSARLAAWLAQAATLPLERAARESFELGDQAIRQLVFDPLLPAPLVDTEARQRCIATVARYDDVGKTIWRRFLAAERERHARAPALASEHPLAETAE